MLTTSPSLIMFVEFLGLQRYEVFLTSPKIKEKKLCSFFIGVNFRIKIHHYNEKINALLYFYSQKLAFPVLISYLNNLRVIIEELFAKKFDGGDSVIVFDVNGVKLQKYGNAIHRDKDILYF